MGLTVTHRFVSAKSDSTDATLVNPTNWNDTHVIVDNGSINSVDFNFTRQAPPESLSPSLRTVTLTAVPRGVNGADVLHNLAIFNNAGVFQESVTINGGTAVSEAATGTVTFAAIVGTYTTGAYKIGSDSSGVREAFIDGATNTRSVYTPAGTYNFYSTLYNPALVNWFGDGNNSIIQQMFTGNGIVIGPTVFAGNFVSIRNLKAQYGVGGFAASGSLWTFRNLADGEVSNLESYLGYVGFNFAGSVRVKYSNLFSNAKSIAYQWANTAVGNAGNFVNLYGTVQANGIYVLIDPTIAGLSISNFLFESAQLGTYGIVIRQTNTGPINELVISNGFVDSADINALLLAYSATTAQNTGSTIHFDNVRFTNFNTSTSAVAVLNYPLFGVKASNCAFFNGGTGGGVVFAGMRRAAWVGNHIDVLDAAAIPLTIQAGSGGEVNSEIEFVGNEFGTNGITPTTVVATDATAHAGIRGSANKFNRASAWGWAATGANNFFDSSNEGLPIDVVASGATLALVTHPFPIFTVNGSTNVTAVSGLTKGQIGMFTCTASTIVFAAGVTIGNAFIAVQNVPVSFYFDGTKIWLTGQSPTVTISTNYIATEGGANNAISGTLTGVTLVAGLQVQILLAHTLQAGANTFNLNGGGALAIKSHRNTASNIGVAYAVGGVISLMYDGAIWQDVSQ